MVVEVEDKEARKLFSRSGGVIGLLTREPVLGTSDCVIDVFDELVTGGKVAEWVHGLDSAAFWIDVGELLARPLWRLLAEFEIAGWHMRVKFC
jgi:hypothetical protein